jgi:hypothetical protein
MSANADLFPGVRPYLWEPLELACEAIEATAGQPFSRPSLAKQLGHPTAARMAIRSLLAVDLIERISTPGARPVFYRVAQRSTAA